MKKWTKWLTVVLVVCLVGNMLAGCTKKKEEPPKTSGSQEASSKKEDTKKESDTQKEKVEEPYEFEWMFAWMREFPPDNDPIKAKIEEATNTKFTPVIPPFNEYGEKVQIQIASGKYPDLIQFIPGMDWKTLAQQGAFTPVDEYIGGAGNIQKNVPENHWDILKMDGNIWGIPVLNVRTPSQMFVRNDWVKELGFGDEWEDKLGVEESMPLEDFHNLLKAMKEKKGATYSGVGVNSLTPLFGAFGIVASSNFYIEEGNEYFRITQHPRMKEALEWIHMLYSEGLIDPEIITNRREQLDNKAIQGKVGMMFDIWNVPFRMYEQHKIQDTDPNAKWVRINPPEGPYGPGYMTANSRVMDGVFLISSKAKHPEKLVQFLDYLQDGEGYTLSQYGIEGEHYNKQGDIIELTEAGKAEWVAVYGKLRKIWDHGFWYSKYDDYAENLEDAAMENRVLSNIAEAFTPGPIWKQYGADLDRYEQEMILKFITGEEKLNKWDDYVKTANETYHAKEIGEEIINGLKADGRIK
ncbi:MAG: extracellular solute-binding protein [Epulopiscium sp.]|nr:extracellular solute-binding protein [Candidatus Epulonipiscium sp.]